jgi:hypothetical protein
VILLRAVCLVLSLQLQCHIVSCYVASFVRRVVKCASSLCMQYVCFFQRNTSLFNCVFMYCGLLLVLPKEFSSCSVCQCNKKPSMTRSVCEWAARKETMLTNSVGCPNKLSSKLAKDHPELSDEQLGQ